MSLTRRQLLGLAVGTGVAWMTPDIFTTVAGAQTTTEHNCCACYEGDPIVHGRPAPGPFIAAAIGTLTDAQCASFCEGASAPGVHGVVLHFTSTISSFTAEGKTSAQPGCHFGTHWLNRVLVYDTPNDGPGWHSHCPTKRELQPLQVTCDRAYWSVPKAAT